MQENRKKIYCAHYPKDHSHGDSPPVNICGMLTDSPNPRHYWKVLKHRLLKEGNQTVTNCNQLKLRAACDMYQVPVTSCADWTTLETESPCYYYFSCAEIEKATKSITIYMILAV